METLVAHVRDFRGVLIFQPAPGSEFPEISWGDSYFYYAPDLVMPTRTQPYGTIITKNYPDDAASDLDHSGKYRVNINVGRDRVTALSATDDPARVDVFVPHPIYASSGWVSVVNPDNTAEQVVALLREAHDAARGRAARRAATENT